LPTPATAHKPPEHHDVHKKAAADADSDSDGPDMEGAFEWASAQCGKDDGGDKFQACSATAMKSYFDPAMKPAIDAWKAKKSGAAAAAPAKAAPAVDAKTKAVNDKTKADVTAKHGARPHMFGGYLDGSNDHEKQFMAALPALVHHLNEVAAKKGVHYRFTAAEIAANFFGEGGGSLLEDDAPAGPISGFESLGIDSFKERRNELAPWMSADLAKYAADDGHYGSAVSENGQMVHTITARDLPQGMEAQAVMFAGARAAFDHDCAAQKIDTAALPQEAWFFWTTIYYNAGPGKGKELLAQNGVHWFDEKWKGSDDAAHNGNIQYDAQWRSATWDYMRRTEGDQLDEQQKAHK